MSQTLYYNIIYNISKAIKFSLNEAIQNFNPSEYTEDEQDVIDNQTINDILEFDYNTFNEMAKIFQKLKIPKKLKPFFIPFLIYISKIRDITKIIMNGLLNMYSVLIMINYRLFII